MSGVVSVVCPFADIGKLKNIHVNLVLLVWEPILLSTFAPLTPWTHPTPSCWYKTRKSFLRLPPWARVKPLGEYLLQKRAVFWNHASRGLDWSINLGPKIPRSCLLFFYTVSVSIVIILRAHAGRGMPRTSKLVWKGDCGSWLFLLSQNYLLDWAATQFDPQTRTVVTAVARLILITRITWNRMGEDSAERAGVCIQLAFQVHDGVLCWWRIVRIRSLSS